MLSQIHLTKSNWPMKYSRIPCPPRHWTFLLFIEVLWLPSIPLQHLWFPLIWNPTCQKKSLQKAIQREINQWRGYGKLRQEQGDPEILNISDLVRAIVLLPERTYSLPWVTSSPLFPFLLTSFAILLPKKVCLFQYLGHMVVKYLLVM